MPKNKFRLYPRGFMGGDLQPQVERTPQPFVHPTAIMTYRVNDHDDKRNAISANSTVEALYASYIKQTVRTGDFTFRKQILLAAFEAFGTPDFMYWFNTQYTKNPAAGTIHNDFLVDTLKFLTFGRRDMSLETWASLVQITDEGNNIGSMPSEAKEFFGISEPGKRRYVNDSNMIDIVKRWCSQPQGLEDLLGTLHILFGNV